jgi:hypothetical protein
MDNYKINAAWEIKDTGNPCRWFIVWKEFSPDELIGCIAGYSGGGTFIKERFYARHKDNTLTSLWVDFTDLITKNEIEFESLNCVILDITFDAESILWEWNDETRWVEDDQIILSDKNYEKIFISDGMGLYSTDTLPFLNKICELSGLTASPIKDSIENTKELKNDSNNEILIIKIKSTDTVKDFKKQLQNKFEVLTPKGNIAGDERKLRAMTDIDISKGISINVKYSDNIQNLIKNYTGINIISTEKIENTGLNFNNEVINIAISRDASIEYSTTGIGCEVAIGKITNEHIKEIIKLVEEDRYFDFDNNFLSDWLSFSDFYHKKGTLIIESNSKINNELNIISKLSTKNWELDINHIDKKDGLNFINIPNEGTFIISIRNEDFILIGNTILPKSESIYKVKLYYDTFKQLWEYKANKFSTMGIVHSMKIGDKDILFDYTDISNKMDYSFPYDVNQFIVHNGKLIAWFSELFNDNPKLQWKNGFEHGYPFLSEYLKKEKVLLYKKNKSLILDEFSKI